MPDKTVLVLGCGMAGVLAARELKRLLPSERVVVIDKAPRASYPPSHAALAVGEVRPRSLLRPRARLARRGIEFINAEAHHIDLANRLVRAESRELRYDYLVLALGAEPAFDAVPGLAESAQAFFTYDAAERLAASLRYFSGGRVLICAPDSAIKWRPAPYEMAMLLEHHFHERKMRQKVEIAVSVPDEAPLAAFGADVSELIAGQLAHKGIDFAGGAPLASVDPAHHIARFAGGAERPFDLLIAIPPQALPRAVIDAGLTGEYRRLQVNPATLETATRDVFAVGDIAALPAADGALAAQSADLARRMAAVVAGQIASRISGAPAPGPPDGRARWFVEVGAGAATMLTGDFIRDPGRVRASQPSIVWHWAKSLVEKYWLYRIW